MVEGVDEEMKSFGVFFPLRSLGISLQNRWHLHFLLVTHSQLCWCKFYWMFNFWSVSICFIVMQMAGSFLSPMRPAWVHFAVMCVRTVAR